MIASAFFSMWQTTLKSFTDGAPLIKESCLHSIRAAFTWDPVDRELRRRIASHKREIERMESWLTEPGPFGLYIQNDGRVNPDYDEEIERGVARMRALYEDFIARHPDHASGRIAYGDFLEEIDEFPDATEQWEAAMKLDPQLPAAWQRQSRIALGNNDFSATLASYAQAIELDPKNWDYHYHVAALVFSNLDKAAAHYEEEPRQSADRAISHYRQALTYNPSNFQLASELAFAYANMAPPNYEQSMATWEYSQRYARDITDLEGVYLSMAQVSIDSKQFDAAREQIALSSLPTFNGQRVFLLKRIEIAEKKSRDNGGG